MNPRIQVEHTVTEETTDVDLVRTQLLVAEGARLNELNLTQDKIRQRGFALQCRITTEDPSAGFRPDTGTISAYRAPGGAGVRLDEGSAYVGAEISPYFDPLLLKLTTRGVDMQTAIARARRAVEEVRIRGVTTNQAFLGKLLDDPDFRAGNLHTTFIDERPQLTAIAPGGDRATRILRLLSERTVNRPFGRAPAGPDPRTKLPRLPKGDPPAGSKQRLTELGPQGLARWLRSRDALQLTDTTLRDAHQSLFATRMRTHDMEVVAPHIARLGADMFSLEVWGGATFDVALRFLAEDPWERIARLRELIPNVCLQMLLRGRNLLGYEPYPDEAVRAFVFEAVDAGVDIFRIFDALNNVEPMRAAIAATVEAGAVAEGAICYTGDLLDPGERLYTLDHYLEVAEQLVDAGAHILAIKDMAGLLRAPAAVKLVTRLRREFDLPVHLHTHDTAGGQLATYLAAIEAGVDAVDGAAASMAGMTSQPSLASIVAATDHTARATGVSLESLLEIEPYWEAVRSTYAPFESGLRAPTGRVYRHQIPGGQLSNLHQQAAGARPGRPLRGGRARVREGQRAAREHHQGDADEQGRGRPRALRRVGRHQLGRAGLQPGALRPARLGDPAPAGRPRDAGRGLPPAVHGARAARRGARDGERARRSRRSCASGSPSRAPTGARRSPSCSSPARRRSAPTRTRATATCRTSRPAPSSTACPTTATSPSSSAPACGSSSSSRRSASPTTAACARCSCA